jgi:hypothetical protein
VAGSELVFPGAAARADGLEAWKQVVERGYEGTTATWPRTSAACTRAGRRGGARTRATGSRARDSARCAASYAATRLLPNSDLPLCRHPIMFPRD